ncbi:hypothetical protein PJK55_14670 [Exiguobacterium sp. MMG028]|uniref:hypothetical protein n=1 Tax=Exiguobacterium sp. MMG028 TaxID=3021979 RepID=UPI0022FF321B|nr:hypothetical protein [Exiguobacterium sp. MMG028]MDA5561980.1 hypothetical protein [Exiguobacterium sp. MMG028]
MQDELLNTKLSKKERKRIERLLMDYHRMPSKIESAKMRAEQAVTASYTVQEGSRNASPSDPTANLAIKRDEIGQMERLKKLLDDQHDLLTDDERDIWDHVYHPRHRFTPERMAQELSISRGHYFYLRNRLISQVASVLEGRYDVQFWESDRHDG